MAIKRAGRQFLVVLENIGRPVFWLFLAIVSTFLFLAFHLGHFLLFYLKKLSLLIKNLIKLQINLPKINLPRIKIPKITFPKKAFLRNKFPKIKIPTLRIPKITLPSFQIQPLTFPRRFMVISLGTTALILLIFSVYFVLLKDLPQPNRLVTRDRIVTTKIYDRHDQLLYKIYRNQNRSLINLQEIPLHLTQATIAIEDAEFYQHHGFSLKGIVRAFFKNLSQKKLYGGSTITQQLVKNALLTPERTFRRKLKEIILALIVEQKFSKDEILQMYLNEVGYGGAVHGVEEASQIYFGKSVKEIDLAEAALLAGLPASPTQFSPFGAHPELAKQRQKLVLNRMQQENYITDEQADQASHQELHFASQKTNILAPHFVMYVKELLAEKYGERVVEEGGLEVKTTLDLNLQNQVQNIVTQEINRLRPLRISNGAALVTNPQTGEVLAMVGSRDYFDLENDGNVNVTLRPRQPGSSIKPVNYSLALENGFTSATAIPDTPITYRVAGQESYSPRNYDNRFHGNVPLRVALASSYNVPAVKVLSSMGVKRMIKRGQEMGITTWDDESRFGLSLTLGGGEVTMHDMNVVYGTLANLGQRIDINPILEVKNYQGEVLQRAKEPKRQRVLSPEVAYILTDILSDNNARTPAFGPQSQLVIPNYPHVAAKTGTTQNLRDNWTIGYTPDYVTSVWVGNNDNTPMSYVASGVTGATPIWNNIMKLLLANTADKEFPKPEGLTRIEICPLTNTLACAGCPNRWEYYLPGTEPKRRCTLEQIQSLTQKKPTQTPTPTL